MDIANPQVYEIIQGLYYELSELFESSHIHIGADEAHTSCWTQNKTYVKSATPFWQERNISPTSEVDISNYYYNKLFQYVKDNNCTVVAW